MNVKLVRIVALLGLCTAPFMSVSSANALPTTVGAGATNSCAETNGTCGGECTNAFGKKEACASLEIHCCTKYGQDPVKCGVDILTGKAKTCCLGEWQPPLKDHSLKLCTCKMNGGGQLGDLCSDPSMSDGSSMCSINGQNYNCKDVPKPIKSEELAPQF